jgi:hypothetical protein
MKKRQPRNIELYRALSYYETRQWEQEITHAKNKRLVQERIDRLNAILISREKNFVKYVKWKEAQK